MLGTYLCTTSLDRANWQKRREKEEEEEEEENRTVPIRCFVHDLRVAWWG